LGDLVTELTSIGKDSAGEKKLFVYLPTRSNYHKTSDEGRESLKLEKNKGGYPSNATTAKKISREEDLFPVINQAFVKQLYGKHVSFNAYVHSRSS